MNKIIGVKANITNVEKFLDKVNNFSKRKNIIIQLFNADLIYGKNHLISAIEHAKRAFDRKTNSTNSLEMEILLYASGERQLKTAIPKMGVKKGITNLAIIIINDSSKEHQDNLIELFSLKRDDKVLEGDINTLKKFGITNQEINTVVKDKYEDLILEKVALVDIIK